MVVVNIHIVGGLKPGGNDGTGSFCLINIDSGTGTHVHAPYFRNHEFFSGLNPYKHAIIHTRVVVAGSSSL